VERALTAGVLARVDAPAMQPAETAKSEGPEALAFAWNLGALNRSGRLDLNQRLLDPKSARTVSQEMPGLARIRNQLEFRRKRLPCLRRIQPGFADRLVHR
jgi:hypothetical protein